MPQEDNDAAELDHAEVIGFVIFPAADQSAKVVKPGEVTLDFPVLTVAAQFAAVLGAFATAVVFVERNEPDAVFLPEALIERNAVVGRVTDHSFWVDLRETLRDGDGAVVGDCIPMARRRTIRTRCGVFLEYSRTQRKSLALVAGPILSMVRNVAVFWNFGFFSLGLYGPTVVKNAASASTA